MVQATVLNKALPIDADASRLGTTDGTGISRGPRAINRQEMAAHSAEPPPDEHGTALLNTYLNQPQYVSTGSPLLVKAAPSIQNALHIIVKTNWSKLLSLASATFFQSSNAVMFLTPHYE